MSSSLPEKQTKFNADVFYNKSTLSQINLNTQDVDTLVGYFQKRGFDQVAAVNTAGVLLRQAYRDELPVYELIDTLKGLTDVQLSNLVAQILNFNRSKSSAIGYRIANRENLFDQRNILV